MPINFAETINGFADKLLNLPILDSAISNPFYMAICISILIIVIVMFIFWDSLIDQHSSNESLLTMSMRVGVWSFFVLTGFLYLYNKKTIDETENATKNALYDEVFKDTSVQNSNPLPVSTEYQPINIEQPSLENFLK